MKPVSVSTYALFDLPLQEAIIRCAHEGWQGIEIMCEERHAELLEWNEGQIRWLKNLAAEKGLSISIHAPFTGCNPAAALGRARDEALRNIQRCLQIANELQCAHVVMHSGEVRDRLDQAACRQGIDNLIHLIQPLLAELKGTRTVLALENVPPYPHVLGWDVGTLVGICQTIGSPNLGIVYDVGHAHLVKPGYAIIGLQEALPHLAGLHLSDNGGVHDDHLAVGEGTIPFAEVLALIHKSSYTGTTVVEMPNLPDASRSVNHLKQMME